MRIDILGTLSLIDMNGRKINIGSRKLRTLVALLALSPRTPVPIDDLVDELWAERPISNARNALQANVARLRKLVEIVSGRPGDELIRTSGAGYILDIPPADVDAHEFVALADDGAKILEERPEEAADLLNRALRLWRGPALADVLDGVRCQSGAGHLEERRLAAREDLVAARLATGRERDVVCELRQLVAEHPERERLSEQLMLALYRTGRQTEALNVFHYLRNWLDDELGLQPNRAICFLYQAILSQDTVLG
ncbi:BTAD domain-containing putative transcriptional regulator [Actinophytocola sp.]|uniref:AfsR/SARP family transcriptional regulator n=1 Tax=Actinophytocola sp. TaxID=1872138 RepID=UPI00389B0D41